MASGGRRGGVNRLARIAALPRQIVDVTRRNGLRNVWHFGANMMARHGPLQTLRYAIAPPELRGRRLVEIERGAVDTVATPWREERFAADWSVPANVWEERTAWRPLPAVLIELPDVRLCFGEPQVPEGAADGDWIVLLRPGDKPAAALTRKIATAGADPRLQVITFDMSFMGAPGRIHPVFQPGVNPWLARCADVGFGRYALRAGVVRQGRGDGYERMRAWMAAHSLNEARDRWAHIAEPLLQAAMKLEDIADARAAAVQRARAGLAAQPLDPERVSVVICTHNRGRLVRQLVRALDDPRIAEVVVVANNTTSPHALETLDWVRSRPNCQVLVMNEAFNFSRLSNAGAALTTGERLLFLNDDVVPITDDWLEPLLEPLRNPEVGVSGALLLYPDESVQHAGMFLGYGGHAGHSLRHARLPEQDYLFYGSVPREVSAVTGAVMMVRRSVFEALNGFDDLLPTFLQDVDFCLRARVAGAVTIWSPFAELLHMESTSMKDLASANFDRQRTGERERFLHRWKNVIAFDPLHNPNLDVEDEAQRTLATR